LIAGVGLLAGCGGGGGGKTTTPTTTAAAPAPVTTAISVSAASPVGSAAAKTAKAESVHISFDVVVTGVQAKTIHLTGTGAVDPKSQAGELSIVLGSLGGAAAGLGGSGKLDVVFKGRTVY